VLNDNIFEETSSRSLILNFMKDTLKIRFIFENTLYFTRLQWCI